MPFTAIQKQSEELLKNLSFCVFDLETTGGNHQNDKIIEIGLVKVEKLKVTKKINYLIQPEIKIPDFIQKLTTITPEDVQDAPLIDDVIEEVLEFMGDSILVAHNTSFDVPFFNSVLIRLGKKPLTNKSLCTNLMTKYLIPNLMNSNLNYMCKVFNINHGKAHRALDDAMAATKLLLIYLNIFIDKGISKVNHLYYPRNRFDLNRCNLKSDMDPDYIINKIMSLNTSTVVTFKGTDGIILFSLPTATTQKDKDLLIAKVKELNWVTLTISLHGPFIESLAKFSILFNKLDNIVKNDILKYLWKTHFPKEKMPMVSGEDDPFDPSLKVRNPEFGDFIIANHLVPDQYIIYPLISLHPKTELVFRYPGHKKKLLQYINSKSSKMGNGSVKKALINPSLRSFIDQHLIYEKDNNSLIFKKSVPIKRPDEFYFHLENFIAKKPNPNHYPKEYI